MMRLTLLLALTIPLSASAQSALTLATEMDRRALQNSNELQSESRQG